MQNDNFNEFDSNELIDELLKINKIAQNKINTEKENEKANLQKIKLTNIQNNKEVNFSYAKF